jgi:hypothetical protein
VLICRFTGSRHGTVTTTYVMDKVCPQRWAHISLSVQDSCRTSALKVVMVRDGREQAIGDVKPVAAPAVAF